MAVAVIAGFALAPVGAAAHSFNLAMVAPISGDAAQAGRDARDGLLLATRERDGHPAEESDGHLGGLDSYVSTIDATGERLADRVAQAVRERRLDIVTGVASPEVLVALGGIVASTGAAFCPAGAGPVAPEALDSAAAAPFVAAFRQAFGRLPGPAAARGYNAGRAVDRAVRALGGVGDRAALTQACGGGG